MGSVLAIAIHVGIVREKAMIQIERSLFIPGKHINRVNAGQILIGMEQILEL